MSRAFPLAGLLRLRRLRQDAAAAELAGANARASAHGARQNAARGELQQTTSEVATAAALSAMAAARSSARSMLAELEAVSQQNRVQQDQAQTVFNEARAGSVRLEKLAAKHAELVAAELLHSEQTVLDEIAVTAWHRDRGRDRGPDSGPNRGRGSDRESGRESARETGRGLDRGKT
ncbi:flagellar export protein FliJ [Paenarthrobacter sp. PH39-S1]|uniref:flagellar export protein FliJ n=1 Tax=Paenarthrobacter sp. PH39-S1 TaxID=3046204 RepID=UPI0024B8F58C|nr:flagellar export protein FliJ [Paenarthrobacter sp. PH39-S1]MDJ0355985.1 flagellar export protein FliJ [Paenarthrobacter sp. PH39-S1]